MSIRPLLLFVLLMVLNLCSCQRHSYVLLSIERGALTPAAVHHLDLALTLDGTLLPPQTVAQLSPIALPTSLALQLGDAQGELEVLVLARDSHGDEVDRGSGRVMLRRSATTALTVHLTDGPARGQLSADSAALELGTVVLGGGAALPTGTFQITNTGRATTGPLSARLSAGTGFAITADLCQVRSLAPTESCSVTVRFQPNVAGAQSTELTITPVSGAPLTLRLSGSAVTPGALVVTPSNGSFDGVVLGSSLDGVFSVKNSGGSATGKLSLSLQGQDAAAYEITQRTCEGLTLQPDGRCSGTVRFRPTSAGPKTASLSIKGDPGGTAVLALSGTGLRPAALALTATQIDLGSVLLNTSSGDGVVVVRNSGDVPTGTLTVMLSGVDYNIKSDGCTNKSLLGGMSCELRVTLTPRSVGAYLGEVVISGMPPLAPVTVRLSGSGIAPAQLVLSPIALDFGTVPVGSSADLWVTVTNTGGARTGPVAGTITMGGAFQADTSICNTPLDPNASCRIKVTFTSTSWGAKSGTLAVSANPGGLTTAPLSGVGRDTLTLSADLQGAGTGTVLLPGLGSVTGVDLTCSGPSCTKGYYRTTMNPQVTISAAPSATSTFAGWQGGGCSGTAPCRVTLSSNTVVAATFAVNQYQLSVFKSGQPGTVKATPGTIDCGALCNASYAHGTLVTLTATPAAGVVFGGWSGDCQGAAPTCQVAMTAVRNVTAAFNSVNYVFVTSKTYTIPAVKALGTGVDEASKMLSGGDKICNDLATQAGIGLTQGRRYVAWLSSVAKSAVSRIPPTATGWVNTAQRPFAENMTSLTMRRKLFYPVALDERGAKAAASYVVTGTVDEGTARLSCQDWTSLTAGVTYGDATGGSGVWTWRDDITCDQAYTLLCFGTDFSTALPPLQTPSNARRAFVLSEPLNGAIGLQGADGKCNSQAQAAGLGGTYKAMLGAPNQSMASRFTTRGAPVYRLDGVQVAPTDTALLASMTALTAPIVVDPLGAYWGWENVWTGSLSPTQVAPETCVGWSTALNTQQGAIGITGWTSAEHFFFNSPWPCVTPIRIYCLQE